MRLTDLPSIPSPQSPPQGAAEPGGSRARCGNWGTAPAVVKWVAYPLAWLSAPVFLLLVLFCVLCGSQIPQIYSGGSTLLSAAERGFELAFCALMLVANAWLIRALRAGSARGWAAQAALSGLGLVILPGLGIVLHGLILWQWFRPEVKAWFGRP